MFGKVEFLWPWLEVHHFSIVQMRFLGVFAGARGIWFNCQLVVDRDGPQIREIGEG